jgi:pyridoxal phosphate enzyme (YggS family)
MDEGATFAERLARVAERIESACRAAGRPPGGVRLLAISKTQPPERVREAAEAGQRLFGENRVQEAQAKIPLCPSNLSWHMVGHLQGNKVRAAARLFDMIHSVDSVQRLRQIDAACAGEGRRLPVCLEINVAGESSKFGLPPGDLESALDAARELAHVDVVGLMTMPPPAPDPERARPHFRRLRERRDECRARTGFELPELSMGMSHDLEVAVQEGATWLRIGTDLFGPRTGAAWRPAATDGDG